MDATDDAGLIVEQYQILQTCIREVMVRIILNISVGGDLKTFQLGAVLSTEIKLAVSVLFA